MCSRTWTRVRYVGNYGEITSGRNRDVFLNIIGFRVWTLAWSGLGVYCGLHESSDNCAGNYGFIYVRGGVCSGPSYRRTA